MEVQDDWPLTLSCGQTCDESGDESSVDDHMGTVLGGHIVVLMTSEKAMNSSPGQNERSILNHGSRTI